LSAVPHFLEVLNEKTVDRGVVHRIVVARFLRRIHHFRLENARQHEGTPGSYVQGGGQAPSSWTETYDGDGRSGKWDQHRRLLGRLRGAAGLFVAEQVEQGEAQLDVGEAGAVPVAQHVRRGGVKAGDVGQPHDAGVLRQVRGARVVPGELRRQAAHGDGAAEA